MLSTTYDLAREEKLKISDLKEIRHNPLCELAKAVDLLDISIKEYYKGFKFTVVISGESRTFEIKKERGKVILNEL